MNRRTFLATGTLALASVTALSGCLDDSNRDLPAEPTGAWHQDAAHSTNTGATDATVPARGNPAWDAGEAQLAPPVVADGTVYSAADAVTAVDGQTGAADWETSLEGDADHAPAIDGDRLLVATDERLVALGRADGAERWSVALPRPARGAITVADDGSLLTVPVGDTGLFAYDPSSGDRLWADDTIAPRTAAIDADAETVYLTGWMADGNTGVLRALDPADGARRWEAELGDPDVPPVVAEAGILIGDEGTLALHDPDGGDRLRELGDFGDRLDPAPTVADGIAYVGTTSDGGELRAVAVDDGTVEWTADVAPTADAGIAVGENAVVASLTSLPTESLAGLAAFDRADGTVLWEHQIEGFDAYPSTGPVLADGAVFSVSNESRGVMALGDLPPEDGE